MYEEVVRVPLVMAGPGIPVGVRRDDLLSLLDVAPTVLDALAFAVPPAMRGRSLLPSIVERRDLEEDDRELLVESPAYGPDSTALVTNRHKLVVRADGPELLFALDQDPEERSNLITIDPGAADSLRTRLRDLTSRLQAADEAQPLVMDEATEAQLRTLGYLD
jgi:arylsulfatase A-like enzyme